MPSPEMKERTLVKVGSTFLALTHPESAASLHCIEAQIAVFGIGGNR
jgi:hypothetical protein